ncbi:hypothetical protein SALBM217S_01406 [Streptomyces griseoloalbus]
MWQPTQLVQRETGRHEGQADGRPAPPQRERERLEPDRDDGERVEEYGRSATPPMSVPLPRMLGTNASAHGEHAASGRSRAVTCSRPQTLPAQPGGRITGRAPGAVGPPQERRAVI